MNDTVLVVVLWGLVAIVLGWTWIPALISGLGGTRYSSAGTEDPTPLNSTAVEPDYAFFHKQIAGLGYEPLGTAWMRLSLYGPEWRYETQVRAFRSREKQSYVFIQKQPAPMDVWWLTMVATCWQDGGLLLTGNAVDVPPSEGEYVLQGMESVDIAAVEALHLATSDRLRKAGRRPDPDQSLDTLLRATRQHAGPAARQTGVKLGQTYFATHLVIHVLLSIPAVLILGFGHWALPLTNVVLGGLLTASDRAARFRAGYMMRAQLLKWTGGDQAAARSAP